MLIGDTLGPYRVVDKLGEGGMGQVFRARDTKLNREVALKALPDSFARDPDRLARFTREAQTLASLNHPHIAAIYGLEDGPSAGAGQDGVRALVMELVEGEDLSQRIARGPIPIDEALPIAKQIAEALEAAHGQGIVHRDLKPANIKVRPDGTVKVLDFGLAKALDEPQGSLPQELWNFPTTTSPGMTMRGMILGTAAYMAPEQARGKAVDGRADIWAFGVVLFEMLTGVRPFRGGDVTDTMVSVISKEPDWRVVPAATPAALRRLLTRCLKKDPRARLQAIGDARVQIDELLSGAPDDASNATMAPAASSASRSGLPWIVAAAALTGLVATAPPIVRHLREAPPLVLPEVRVEITTPATDAPLQFALSPDGRALAFVASGDGPPRLWLRPLDQAEARPLVGTEGATALFWSPDSRAIGFFANGRLLRLDLAGGAPRVLAGNAGALAGGSWSPDGTILFGHAAEGSLWRVMASGGEPVQVTQNSSRVQLGHRSPHFLPDGRHFLFYMPGPPEQAEGIYLGSLDGGAPARLTAAESGGAFLPPDLVAFVRQGTLVARRLDLAGRVLTGDPITIADGVGVDQFARGGFAASAASVIAYRAGGGASRRLTWLDRTGKAVGAAGEPDGTDLRFPEFSPDGRRVAMRRTVQGNTDIWLLDLVRGGLTRLTFDAAADLNAVWSADGTRIAFNRRLNALYVKPSNGLGAETLVADSPDNKVLQDWSRDGRWMVYYDLHQTNGRDLWAMDTGSPDHPRRAIANTPAEEVLAALSPDAQWVAYQTNESGRFEVVVQPFPDGGGKWQVSMAGGVAPRWRADGKELYFLAPDATLMALPVTTGSSFEAGAPVALFPTRVIDGGTIMAGRPHTRSPATAGS